MEKEEIVWSNFFVILTLKGIAEILNESFEVTLKDIISLPAEQSTPKNIFEAAYENGLKYFHNKHGNFTRVNFIVEFFAFYGEEILLS